MENAKFKKDFKPTDLTLDELVKQYFQSDHSDFQSPAQQVLRSKIIKRMIEIFGGKIVRRTENG
jgi:hypothetical protein